MHGIMHPPSPPLHKQQQQQSMKSIYSAHLASAGPTHNPLRRMGNLLLRAFDAGIWRLPTSAKTTQMAHCKSDHSLSQERERHHEQWVYTTISEYVCSAPFGLSDLTPNTSNGLMWSGSQIQHMRKYTSTNISQSYSQPQAPSRHPQSEQNEMLCQ